MALCRLNEPIFCNIAKIDGKQNLGGKELKKFKFKIQEIFPL